jgi:hypothetical protein
MRYRPPNEDGSHLALAPDRFPRAFRHEAGNACVVSVLFSQTPDEWRRTWRDEVVWTPRREAMLDVVELSRGATAASPQLVPQRDIALTTLERPVSAPTIVDAVASSLETLDPHDTIVYVDDLGGLAADVGEGALRDVVTSLSRQTPAVGGRSVFCLDPGDVTTATVDALRDAVDVVHGDATDGFEGAVRELRRTDPTNYGYARRHWREARAGIEASDRNFPLAKQIHATLDDPETTPRTLGATLKALVALGVIDTWSETVGSTRYDLTAYDPDLLEAVGGALDAAD